MCASSLYHQCLSGQLLIGTAGIPSAEEDHGFFVSYIDTEYVPGFDLGLRNTCSEGVLK